MSGSDPSPLSVEFDPAAREEFAQAVAWYDQQQQGLGDRFVVELKRTIQRIRDFPNAWQKLSKRSRRCRLSRFPYGVIYQLRPGAILILAVSHLHRRPNHWKEREVKT